MISVTGVSHREAGLGTRELLRLDAADLPTALRAAGAAAGDAEVAVLSTCNRTEVYVGSADVGSGHAAWAALTGADIGERYVHHGVGAVHHLLRVACGMDSAILGDQQILGQVRAALAAAVEAGTAGPILREAFATAIGTARRSRRETDIGAGAPGIGAAVARAMLGHGVGTQAPIAVLGAGTAAQGVVKHLRRAGFTALAFLNRTPAGSRGMAERFGGRAEPWSALDGVLAASAAVVAATAASRPVLDAATLERAVTARGQGSGTLLVVDAGLPRNVERSDGVTLLDLDDLSWHDAAETARREAAVPAVQALIDRELAAWERRWAAAPVELAIKDLYLESNAAARRLARELAREPVAVSEAERIVRRTLNAVLHEHVGRLRGLVTTDMEG